jgi:uncharacterized membrane protein (DUF485 family)
MTESAETWSILIGVAALVIATVAAGVAAARAGRR